MRSVQRIVNFILILCLMSGCALTESQNAERSSKTAQKKQIEEHILSSTESISDLESEPAETEPSPETVPPEPAPEEQPFQPVTLFFASDYQDLGNWPYPGDTLSGILESAAEDGKSIDSGIYCGDYSNIDGYSNHQIDPEEYIAEIKEILSEYVSDPDAWIFVQGNHDKLTESISASGLHEYDGYLVYVLNTQDDYPWKQGLVEERRGKVENSAAALEKCLDELAEKKETRPVFVAAHVPLHFSGRTSSLYGVGDNMYSSMIFEVLNDAGEDLDLIYLYGHNHSKGWDSYMGGSCVFRKEGDFILVPEYEYAEEEDEALYTDAYTQETLHFTYLNAGFTGYYSGSGADKTLTGTVCEIYPDYLEFTRYEDGGRHRMSSAGAANPKYDDSELIPEEYYGHELESPQVISRKTVQ